MARSGAELPRPILCTIEASRVGRVISLAYLKAQGRQGATPDEIRTYMKSSLGWEASDGTLYTYILPPLRVAGKTPDPVVDVFYTGTDAHAHTRYVITPAGLDHLEDEKKKLIGHQAPLSSAQQALKALHFLLKGSGERLGIVTNMNVLLRWLILHTLVQIGPSSPPTIRRYIYGCTGEVVYTPQRAVAAESWPRVEVIRRAVNELAEPTLSAVTKEAGTVYLTPTGEALYRSWRRDLADAVELGLKITSNALTILQPGQTHHAP